MHLAKHSAIPRRELLVCSNQLRVTATSNELLTSRCKMKINRIVVVRMNFETSVTFHCQWLDCHVHMIGSEAPFCDGNQQ